jgi:hypothetical protein
MTAGCPFITCAVKKKGLEFCGHCMENEKCEKWQKHRDAGRQHDSSTCYQKLEENIAFILGNSLGEFDRLQKLREGFLKEMLQEFNEGRSKTYYCIASTVLEIDELEAALKLARKSSQGQEVKGKSRVLHAVLDDVADKKQYRLKLRK